MSLAAVIGRTGIFERAAVRSACVELVWKNGGAAGRGRRVIPVGPITWVADGAEGLLAMQSTRAGLVEPKRFELIDVDLAPGPGEVLVEVSACGICSSEIPVYTGDRPVDMPAFLGHEGSGVVVAVGPGVEGFAEGERVTGAIWQAFATHAIGDADMLFKVPDGVDMAHALGEPLFCVANIARAAAPRFGDHVAVVGCGQMGLLTIAALRNQGLGSLIAVDALPERRQLALAAGATHVTIDDPVSEVMDISGRGADVVVELVGKPGGLRLATDMLRRGQGRLIMGGYHQLDDTYHLRNFSYQGLIAHSAHPAYSPDMAADYRRALAALARGVFPMDLVVTHRLPLDGIAEGFDMLRSHAPGYLKGVVVPGA
ncbi:MAG: alcohol dehydrogenase catalytic domain-containing protein [Chloroflexota bacterium]|nr:alcohol dehydrogenase catalytic domain-containing protein [Chloroflexota bacterium]